MAVVLESSTHGSAFYVSGPGSHDISFSTAEDDRLLAVMLGSNRTDLTVSYGGTALTVHSPEYGYTTNQNVKLFYLLAPATGSNTLSIGYPNAISEMVFGVYAFSGVDQDVPLGNKHTLQNYMNGMNPHAYPMQYVYSGDDYETDAVGYAIEGIVCSNTHTITPDGAGTILNNTTAAGTRMCNAYGTGATYMEWHWDVYSGSEFMPAICGGLMVYIRAGAPPPFQYSMALGMSLVTM